MENSLVVKSSFDLSFEAFERLEAIANKFSSSKLIPVALQGKPADVAIILQMGYELGMGPMQSVNGIDVIQGKPSVKPEMQVALIKAKAPDAFISIETDPAAMSVTVTMAPSESRMKESFTTTWDMSRAKDMQLDKKDNYLKQPLVMLKWRALGEAARTVFPHITKGLYNTEEAQDLDNTPPPSDGSKARALNAMLKPKEEKEVKAEVKTVEPVVTNPTPYRIPAGKHPVCGKRFDEVTREALHGFYDEVLAQSMRTEFSPEWNEFLERAKDALENRETKFLKVTKPAPIKPAAVKPVIHPSGGKVEKEPVLQTQAPMDFASFGVAE